MRIIETFLAKPILEEVQKEKLPEGVLCRVTYPICNIGQRNANGRVYEDAVWDKVIGEDDLKERLANRALFGHAEHPEQTQSNLEKTSHVIFEMWKGEKKVWQRIDVLDTPTGRIVDTLLRAECQVGVSTRAEGDLEEAEDDEGTYQRVIPESYRYVTTDFTADPSTFGVMPQDVKRNVVSEVRKVLENKEINGSEKEFATLLLESMRCNQVDKCQECGCCKALKENTKRLEGKVREKKYIVEGTWALPNTEKKAQELLDLLENPISFTNLHSKMWNLYGTDMMYDELDALQEDILPSAVEIARKHLRHTLEAYEVKPESFKTKFDDKALEILKGIVEEHRTLKSLIKDNVIKVGTELKYGDKDAKVEKIEEFRVSITIGDTELTHVNLEGDLQAHVATNGVVAVSQLPVPPVTEPKAELAVEPVGPPQKEVDQMAAAGPLPIEKDIPESKVDEKRWRVSFTDGHGEVDSSVINASSKEDAEDEILKYHPEYDIKDTKEEIPERKVMGPEDKIEVGDVIEIRNLQDTETVVSASKVTEVGTMIGDEDTEFHKVKTEKGGDKWYEAEGYALVRVSEIREWKLPVEGGVSDRIAPGNVLRCKEDKYWVVRDIQRQGLTVEAIGEGPGTEKFVDWNEVDDYGFVKIGEKKLSEADEKILDDISNREFSKGSKVDEVIVKRSDGWYVQSETGKNLGGPYATKTQAEKRLAQVEMFKHMDENKLLEEFYNFMDEKDFPDWNEGVELFAGDRGLDVNDLTGRFIELFPVGIGDVSENWEDLPKGWTKASLKSFARSLLGKVGRSGKGFVTACVAKMKGKVDNPAAFCAGLKDEVMGTTKWRGKESKVDERKSVDEMRNILRRFVNERLSLRQTLVKLFDRTVGFDEDMMKKEIIKWLDDASGSDIEDLYRDYIGSPSESKSISNTAKEIKDLKVKEASTRAERDKALELLEEITDEKSQLGEKVRKDKTLEAKILINKIRRISEADEQELSAVRTKLEEKAKLASELRKEIEEKNRLATELKEKLNEINANMATDIENLEKLVKANEEKHQFEIAQLENEHTESIEQLKKEANEKISEEVKKAKEEIKEKVTSSFVKSFVEFRLAETGLKVDDNSRALLESCKSLEEVDDTFDDILDTGRRSALHSELVEGIRISKSIVDPEQAEAERSVSNAFKGMNET